MDGGPEETDITDGDTTYADITDAEGNCDNGQEEDTDNMDSELEDADITDAEDEYDDGLGINAE